MTRSQAAIADAARSPSDAQPAQTVERVVGAGRGPGALNLVKLCVGADEVSDLVAWQAHRAQELAREIGDPRPRHTTRMQPKRATELLAGGSLYWVFRGVIRARQRLEAIEPVDCPDGIRRYDLVLNPEVAPTDAQPRRAFQGWRYLPAADAPQDLLTGARREGDAPPALLAQIAEFGVL